MKKGQQQEVVLYIGTKKNPFICISCGRKIVKGFIRQKDGYSGCTELCIKNQLPKNLLEK
jgi:hypothetical protein